MTEQKRKAAREAKWLNQLKTPAPLKLRPNGAIQMYYYYYYYYMEELGKRRLHHTDSDFVTCSKEYCEARRKGNFLGKNKEHF